MQETKPQLIKELCTFVNEILKITDSEFTRKPHFLIMNITLFDTTINIDAYVYYVFWAGGLCLLNKLMLCYVKNRDNLEIIFRNRRTFICKIIKNKLQNLVCKAQMMPPCYASPPPPPPTHTHSALFSYHSPSPHFFS